MFCHNFDSIIVRLKYKPSVDDYTPVKLVINNVISSVFFVFCVRVLIMLIPCVRDRTDTPQRSFAERGV